MAPFTLGSTLAAPFTHPGEPSAAKHRPILYLSLGTAAFLAIVILNIGLFFAFSPDNDSSALPEVVKEERPFNFSLRTPGIWHDALDQQPKPLIWPETTRKSSYFADTDAQTFVVDAHDISLLALGELADVPYKIRIDVQQQRWEGGSGVFFGYNEQITANGREVKFQVLEFRRLQDGRFAVYRDLLVGTILTKGFFKVQANRSAPRSSQIVSDSTSDLETLEIQVSKFGLHNVRWGGKYLDSRTAATINDKSVLPDYVGYFGVFNRSSSCTYSQARVFITSSTGG